MTPSALIATPGVLPILSIAVLSLVYLTLSLFSVRLWFFGPAICLVAGLLSIYSVIHTGATGPGDLLYADGFTKIFNLLILFGAFCTFLLNQGQLERQNVGAKAGAKKIGLGVDIDLLMLLAVCGAMVMVSAANLIVLFVGFELLSVCVYVLTGIARDEKSSAEGALKYFLLGAFSSAFLLYGMTLVFGATASMDLATIASRIHGTGSGNDAMLLLGLGLMIFGFAFKVSLVPFHFWTPDVYQGAPTSIAAFMAVVVKAAAFGAFIRLMFAGFEGVHANWVGLVWVLSALTMTVGNLVALRQTSLKRMLAYSSIAHAGYAMIGFLPVAGSSGELSFIVGGGEATIFYLVAYSFMTIAAFGVVLLVTSGTKAQYSNDTLESFRGLGWRSPALGLVMTVAILSLGGMPPFAGFIGKFYLFNSAVKAGYVGIAIIAALNSLVSLYYYLRVLVVMYFESNEEQPALHVVGSTAKSALATPQMVIGVGPAVALGIASLGTVYLGICSQTVFRLAHQAMLGLS